MPDTRLPAIQLQAIGPDIWIAEGPGIRMDFGPITSFPFPTRMTVIRLANGDIFCHSPIELSPPLMDELEREGPVRHLVSPNWMHYAHVPAWKQAYPGATAWGSPGVERRMQKQGVAFRFDAALDASPPPAWAGEIDQMIFEGSSIVREVVFFHRRSRTLILTDLVQNHDPDNLSVLARMLAAVGGALSPDGTTPLDLRLSFLGHKRTVMRNLEQMRQWQPERIVIAHGRWFPTDGGKTLERIFAWARRMPF